jgi:signal-transduction protein with cAMP-binding, CBS, and nucleotidyltransferase domain
MTAPAVAVESGERVFQALLTMLGRNIHLLLPLFMREGARASHITRVVAELNDRVMSKILKLAE